MPCSGSGTSTCSGSGFEPACKINAALLALDQEALKLPCGLLDDATIAEESLNPGRDPLQMYYAHYVDVTLQGRSFLALHIQDFGTCPGGAHGWTTISSVTLDLQIGEKVAP